MEKIKELKAMWLDQLLVVERAQQQIEAIKREIVKLQQEAQEKKQEEASPTPA